jgi:predicted small secreted protein
MIVWSLLIAALGISAGCNTLNGFGKDVERAGEKMKNAGAK